ncbi:MAG: hypothetical protein JW976_13415 [Syntrophaceae bacterium]|nr:hypothetical protein [Syntrophaceae bacterium]
MPQLKLIFEKQWIHAGALAVLIILVVLAQNLDGMNAGMFLGTNTPQWFWLAIFLPIIHQVFVWFCWRIQLHGHLLYKAFGKLSYPVYALFFFTLGTLRVLSVFALAISNRDTLILNITILKIFAVIITIPALYLLYSVMRYFSFKRAAGIDHFDERYRSRPLVRKGIFRFTRNGMYAFGFLFLWIPALWYASMAALFAALFNHLYIWVHYFTTELPDMKQIYGKSKLST